MCWNKSDVMTNVKQYLLIIQSTVQLSYSSWVTSCRRKFYQKRHNIQNNKANSDVNENLVNSQFNVFMCYYQEKTVSCKEFNYCLQAKRTCLIISVS